ncbi:MAG: hypothetical protein K2O69_02855 [Odoribacter sp.]|nr:hypothetical protein [Odoribacter sp.]
MKKIYLYMASVVAAWCCLACSEDAIEPNPLEPDYFLEPQGSSPAIAALQKEFHQKENIYLLFNDTLYRESIGTDGNGKPCYRYTTIDMTYGMTNNLIENQNIFEYDYLASDSEKESAAAFVREKVLPSLGSALRPYSVLLVNRIDYYKDSYGELALTKPAVYAGWQATAIAVEGVADMTEEEQNAYKMSLLKSMVANKITAADETLFEEFYSFCAPYYGTFKMGEEADVFTDQYPTLMDIGLLEGGAWAYGKNPYGSGPLCNFKGKEYDLQNYIDTLFDMPESEFRETYAQYPIVLKKYDILKKIVSDMGVIF